MSVVYKHVFIFHSYPTFRSFHRLITFPCESNFACLILISPHFGRGAFKEGRLADEKCFPEFDNVTFNHICTCRALANCPTLLGLLLVSRAISRSPVIRNGFVMPDTLIVSCSCLGEPLNRFFFIFLVFLQVFLSYRKAVT